jgi:hypothetical protein
MIEPSNERTDTMKGKITLVFIIALVVGGMVGFAGDGNGASGNRCNPAGTWYAELPSPPYTATITPIQGHSRYSVMFQGVYGPSLFGMEVMTDWSGELVKSGDGYDGAAIAILGGGEDFPHWNPLHTWGVKGHIVFSDDCNTMFAEWPGGIYVWVWDTVTFPFVPPPTPWVDVRDDIYPLGTDTIYETYHRMPMPTD